jgi:hypothetical protein
MAQARAVARPLEAAPPQPRGLALLTVFYEDADARRRDEFLACLGRNVANSVLAEIHVFVEAPDPDPLLAYPLVDDAKVHLVRHGRRTTYGELFAYANDRLPGRRVVVANADIYFDRSLARFEGYDLADTLICLSRWEVEADGSTYLFEHAASQDAWIFETPIPAFPCDFHLGLPGCDNRLAWEASNAGLRLCNPARSVRAYHLHLSRVHRYSEAQRLNGPAESVAADFLGPGPDVPCASVAFAESMGYGIAKLGVGVSSHVNEPRPFIAVPERLQGLEFTQVVASSVSPVEIEFLTSGKLFVLVGNDWYGCQTARDWLAGTGFHEQLPLVETGTRIGFETWSLLGEAGDVLTVPTQVMLAADHLARTHRPG